MGGSCVVDWAGRLKAEDRRAITPLIFESVNPYTRLELDMDTPELPSIEPNCAWRHEYWVYPYFTRWLCPSAIRFQWLPSEE